MFDFKSNFYKYFFGGGVQIYDHIGGCILNSILRESA